MYKLHEEYVAFDVSQNEKHICSYDNLQTEVRARNTCKAWYFANSCFNALADVPFIWGKVKHRLKKPIQFSKNPPIETYHISCQTETPDESWRRKKRV